MRDTALHRLMVAADRISAVTYGVPPDMPERNRDPDYQHAAELTVVADWLEGVSQRLTSRLEPEPEPEPEVEGGTDGNHPETQNKRPRR